MRAVVECWVNAASDDDDRADDDLAELSIARVRRGQLTGDRTVDRSAAREWRADVRPIGVGTRFSIRGRLGAVPSRGMSEVVTWDPPSLAEYRSVIPTWPFRMTAHHRFEDHSDGGTIYTWAISFYEVNVVARPLIAVARRLFQRAFAAQADALAAYLDERVSDEPMPRL